MDGFSAAEQGVPVPASVKEAPKPTSSWEELRNFHASSRYSELYAAYLQQSKKWQESPGSKIDPRDWNGLIDRQIADADELVTSFQDPNATMEKQGAKIFAFGRNRPSMGKDTLTRVYVGVDPRHATDAYKALLESLSEAEVLADIDVALHLDEVETKKLVGDTIIIYEPSSRPGVLDKVLTAYNKAKEASPSAFALSDRQKDFIVGLNFDTFKATVDANMSFVEIPAEDGIQSYHAELVNQTKKAFSIPPNATDEQKLARMQEVEQQRVVWDNATQKRISEGSVKPGDALRYKRKLSAPALVQMGTVVKQ